MKRNNDLALLHPVFRSKVQQLTEVFVQQELPFKLFEGFRSPNRQASLYAQGRTQPGAIVTKAKPWSSYHQYGVAADFVLFINNQWSWQTSGAYAQYWKQLKIEGEKIGLQSLSWETPHLQLQSITLSALKAGQYPEDGDASWQQNLEDHIYQWQSSPAAPPLPKETWSRPPLPIEDKQNGSNPLSDQHISTTGDHYRVTARSGLRLRAGPNTSFETLSVLPFAQPLSVISVENGWAKVDLEDDGKIDGYCYLGFLERI